MGSMKYVKDARVKVMRAAKAGWGKAAAAAGQEAAIGVSEKWGRLRRTRRDLNSGFNECHTIVIIYMLISSIGSSSYSRSCTFRVIATKTIHTYEFNLSSIP